MKKTLLALAVLGAFASTAYAQTSVQIYGIADAGIRYADDDVNDSWALESGMQSGSRLGFRGTEDLGNGVSAIFTLEAGFNIDNGTHAQSIAPSATTPGLNRLFGRQAFVGLTSNSFGTIKLGRQYTPIRVAVESIDPFGIGLAGNAANVFNVHGERTDNTLNYTSPNIAGFSGQIAYSFGEQTSFQPGRHAGASLGYANGPISVVVAYHDQNLLTGGTATAFPTTPNGDERTALIGGTFDFGMAKLHAAWSASKREDAATGNFDRDDAMIGVTAPIGSGAVLASYLHRKDDSVADADAGQFALGYVHNISKRTNFYTSLAYTKNDPAGRLNNPAVAGGDPKVFNVGVRHRF